MKNTIKINTIAINIFLVLILALFSALSCFMTRDIRVQADTSPDINANVENESEFDSATPYGLFVTISISLNGGDGKVYTTARNDFTLFPATVKTYIYLYCSDTVERDYTKMEFVSSNYIADLDMGETVTATGLTGGSTKYWVGRVYYKVDNEAWKEMFTDVLLYDGNGTYLEVAYKLYV